jgi:hypothetical protein
VDGLQSGIQELFFGIGFEGFLLFFLDFLQGLLDNLESLNFEI